ncbi:BtrH N-terminal domain-containing protein [Roseiconus lacunae]|uniref:BtrH N-terminal domain-containing protein n=1 Tax=Roseiconus lacunae TaxID=2605694 RepID=UPI001E4D2071|nr:BtrH N-terminal domain-containing protein [Roseiconus lacunae]MCD0460635.1 BtrH N-terminal domain-containing protein [Roseiconus lacunae]
MMSPSDRSKPNSYDDADPMIDALLMEFVSGDQSRRRQPPDLTATILARLSSTTEVDADSQAAFDRPAQQPPLPNPASGRRRLDVDGQPLAPPVHLGNKLTSAVTANAQSPDDGDPVVDSLLKEFISVDLGKRTVPPDLSAAILSRLNDSVVISAVQPMPRGHLTVVKTLSAIVAMAACVAGVMYLGPRSQVSPSPIKGSSEQLAGDQSMQSDGTEHSPALLAESAPGDSEPNREPLRGIRLDQPLVASSDRDAEGHSADSPSGTVDRQLDSSAPGVRVASESVVVGHIEHVATTTASIAKEYWKSVGVNPTPRASDAELVVRLQRRLGVEVPIEAFAQPERLRDELAKPSRAREIAKRWLALSADWNVGAIDRDDNQSLIEELSRSVAGATSMDTTLVSLISGENKHSEDWYRIIGRDGSEGIARRLAGLSMNADLRCVRCHDSTIGRNGTQDDYWSFVALVRSHVHKDEDHWTVEQKRKQVPTFYELIDGRQRLAVPQVSGNLTGGDPLVDFQAWAQTLNRSQRLASSLVDSLWKLVHGRPLQPSPVDAFAPPTDSNLHRLHDQLATDLRHSGFDIARTLALIVSSPMATRSVPQELRPESMLTTNDHDRDHALDLVTAFAAAVEPPPSSRRDRIEVAMQKAGGRLLDDGTLLAQPAQAKLTPRDLSSTPKLTLSRTDQISVDFPGDDAGLPVSWIRSIDSFDQRVQHLVYLSGGRDVPPVISETAERLRQTGSEDAALSRIWWILR